MAQLVWDLVCICLGHKKFSQRRRYVLLKRPHRFNLTTFWPTSNYTSSWMGTPWHNPYTYHPTLQSMVCMSPHPASWDSCRRLIPRSFKGHSLRTLSLPRFFPVSTSLSALACKRCWRACFQLLNISPFLNEGMSCLAKKVICYTWEKDN